MLVWSFPTVGCFLFQPALHNWSYHQEATYLFLCLFIIYYFFIIYFYLLF